MANDDRPTRAKELLRQKKYPEAGRLFHELWEEKNDPWSASRYLHCLRKAGHCRWAVEKGREIVGLYPQDVWVRREFVWALYEHGVKPAASEEDLGRLLQVAEELMQAQPEDLPRRLTTMAVIRVAKKRRRWETASSWCDILSPEELDDSPRSIDGRAGKSDRETWYFSKIKCLVELACWEEAFSLAKLAASLYPREINFRRWVALSRAGQGGIQEAINCLEMIILKERGEWYLFQDLCELYLRKGDFPAALRCGCKGALVQMDDKVKVSLYFTLAQVGLATGDLAFAEVHLSLAKLVRHRENWSIPAEFTSFEKDLRAASSGASQQAHEGSQDIAACLGRCRQLWHSAVYSGLPRTTGMVESCPVDRPHAWIRGEDGERVFVLRKDLPQGARQVGAVVDLALEPSWDRKKEKTSVRAVDIRLVGRGVPGSTEGTSGEKNAPSSRHSEHV